MNPLSSHDLQDVASLGERLFSAYGLRAVDFTQWMALPSVAGYGRWKEGQLIGFVLIMRCEHVADVLAIGVHPSEQGQGVGRSIIGYALLVAQEMGCAEVRLTVAEENDRAIQLFSSVAFETLGPHHSTYGAGQVAIRMRRVVDRGDCDQQRLA